MAMFIELNGGTWEPATPDIDDAEAIMLAVAAGSITEAELARWLSDRISFEESS